MAVLLLGALWFALLPSLAEAQQATAAVGRAGTHGSKRVRASGIAEPPTVDGALSEPLWRQGAVATGFIQKDPLEGQSASEATEFRIVYTATTLYIGVTCYDADSQAILATDRRRDSRLENDDIITLVIDTFHDHRNAFMFRTNALGTRYDALVTDEGETLNENWDENWAVAAQVTAEGWSAEFAIPFKSLRVGDNYASGWGVDIERIIRRKNEQTYWSNFARGFKLENVSQAGHVQGIENIETGTRFRIKPYMLAGLSQQRRRVARPVGEPFRVVSKNASDVGMEVLKYRITPSLTADFTWNTDFAQTEVDDQQVNLDRFSLFFPEKREFFLEGAGVYEFGLTRSESLTDMKLLHTRRIGLSEGRTRLPVPITAGARITGNLEGFTLGMMNVQTDAVPAEGIRENNYTVLRVKRNVLSRSYVGGFFLNREFGGLDDFNRVYGVDAEFNFLKHLNIANLWGASAEPAKPRQQGSDWVSSGNATWEDDFFLAGTEYAFIEPNFRDDLGFLTRTNVRRITPVIGFKPRPRSGFIRQLNFNYRHDYITDRNWNVLTKTLHYNFYVAFQSGDSISTSPIHFRFDRLAAPFRVRPGIIVPAGDHRWWYTRIQYTANPARRLSGSITFKPEVGYFGGNLVQWDIQPRLRLTNKLSFDLSYRLNTFDFDEREFTDHVVNFRAFYNFNNQWLTTTTIQYNNVDMFAGVNFRLNYIFHPGDNFFLVYNDGRRTSGAQLGERDRAVLAKLSYSFDF